MNFLIKNKKYFTLILTAVIVFNFLFLPLTALAAPAAVPTMAKDDSATADTGGVVSWLTGKSVLFISSTISALFGALFGVILYLEAQIIDYILAPNNFSFTNTSVVQVGWGITRDLANMFLILILLAIAFATVLKIQSYAIKQLWWKVLVVALLINFSLVIAGLVIDFTQVLTGFFLNQITGGGSFGTITTRLASSMQILNFYNPAAPKSIGGGIVQFGASAMAAVIGIILTLVGLVITVFVFGATAIFLIVRIIYIWFLLIVAPIASILWILPATSGYFKQWWDKFIQWSFFAPAYVFMIYLSLSIFEANGKFRTDIFASNASKTWDVAAPGLTQVGMPSAIFQWILVIAMMFGSLIVAKSFGVLPNKLISAVTGATKGAAKSTALWATKSYGQLATGAGTAIGGWGAKAGRSPIVRNITFGVGAGLQAVGGVATGAKGGKFTAPLAKIPTIPLGWKSTPLSLLKTVGQGAVAGSGLFKKQTNVYECQNCYHTVQEKTTPTYNCPVASGGCGATATLTPGVPYADWTQV